MSAFLRVLLETSAEHSLSKVSSTLSIGKQHYKRYEITVNVVAHGGSTNKHEESEEQHTSVTPDNFLLVGLSQNVIGMTSDTSQDEEEDESP